MVIFNGVTKINSGLQFLIDGGGSAITATALAGVLTVPFDCTLTDVSMLADQTGSIAVDIWKTAYANFDSMSVANSIVSATPPTIVSGVKVDDNALNGWTKTFKAGDILGFYVNSCVTITRLSIMLNATRS
jgi:hypothetical protein